ncbi:hypothetical protein AB1Y20_007355 [Prymnesium parvum]|uniref:Phospholipid/glycerol acyltransferase domain-containing protein n=1 Tax=Prymnesium parvum TaxID=97485 RepID=A0AB34IXA8_PRYPA
MGSMFTLAVALFGLIKFITVVIAYDAAAARCMACTDRRRCLFCAEHVGSGGIGDFRLPTCSVLLPLSRVRCVTTAASDMCVLRAALMLAAIHLASAVSLTPRISPHHRHTIRRVVAVPRMSEVASNPGGTSSLSKVPPLPVCPPTNKVGRTILGIYFAFACFGSAIIVYPPLIVITLTSLFIDNTRRRWCDWIVQAWARLTLVAMRASVTVEGLENLPPHGEAVLYAPNHCSFLDIFALSGYLPRRFKYVSKIEILRIPLIGWAMQFAKHIAIRREDRASQMQTFKDAIECLSAGSSLVTFPEGTRSKDGRLLPFKKGPFTMAARAGVRVVPISIIGTHVYQPPSCLAPIARPRGLRIVVHPPLPAPEAKKEQATLELARAAIMSALHPSMLPKDAS